MNSKKLSFLFWVVMVAVVAHLSAIALWLGDDLHYQFSFSTDAPISSVADVFWSQNAHYFTINGRYVAHFLVQSFVALYGRTWFVVANCAAYSLFVALNVGLSGALIIYAARHYKHLTVLQWCLFFSFGLGALLLVLSPGSQHRLGETGTLTVSGLLHSAFVVLTSLRLTFVALLVLAVGLQRRCFTWRQVYHANAFEIHVYGICLLMNLYIHIYCNRQMFGMELMALIILLRMLMSMENRRAELGVVAVLSIIFVSIYVSAWQVATGRADDYAQVLTAYEHSSDGTVYYDLQADEDVGVFNNEPCDRINWPYNMKWMNEWLHLQPENRDKELCILPTHMHSADTVPTFCIDCSGAVYVMLPRQAHVMPVVKRSVTILGLHRPHSDHVISTSACVYEDSLAQILLLVKSPFINHDTVVFQPVKP